MTKGSAIALLVLVFMTACSLVPKLQEPQFPVEDHWQTDPSLSPDNAAETEAFGWQAFFQSPTMRDLIEAALANNRDLRKAALQVEAARALYRIERADLLPNANAQISSYHERSPEALNGEDAGSSRYSEYSANIASTSFELDIFGRIRSRNQAALENFLATQAARQTVQIALVAEVANTYLQWLADRKVLELSKETLATQEQTHELIRKRYEYGISTKLDLAQVRTSVEAARASVALYTRRTALDRNALHLLVGTTAPLPLTDEQSLDELQIMRRLPVALPSEVLLKRPDVRQAEHHLRAANANIGAARAAFFPRIALTGALGFASDQIGDLFSDGAAGAWSFVPSMTIPIFQAGRNKANLKYAETGKQIALVDYEKAIQRAFREVSDQLSMRSSLEEEHQAQAAQVAAAQEAYALSSARYKAGVDSYLSVLDAQRFLFQAQTRTIEIERLQFANLVNLFKTLGGGLNP